MAAIAQCNSSFPSWCQEDATPGTQEWLKQLLLGGILLVGLSWSSILQKIQLWRTQLEGPPPLVLRAGTPDSVVDCFPDVTCCWQEPTYGHWGLENNTDIILPRPGIYHMECKFVGFVNEAAGGRPEFFRKAAVKGNKYLEVIEPTVTLQNYVYSTTEDPIYPVYNISEKYKGLFRRQDFVLSAKLLATPGGASFSVGFENLPGRAFYEQPVPAPVTLSCWQ